MNLWRSLGGVIRVNLTSSDPALALRELSKAGITVYNATRQADDIVVQLVLDRRDLQRLKVLAGKKGYNVQQVNNRGIYWTAKRLLKRPILVLGVFVFLLLVFYLPSRVFFVRIEGNERIPDRLILEKCEECGIRFGASRRQVRSEKMKNALLEAIPELQWAGINTSGCVATITVRERSDADIEEQKSGVSSIVAACDGIITSCTVIRGTGVCQVGQAVREGQLLVSGYTDCGISIQACRAQAEIYAQTRRELTVVAPTNWLTQGDDTKSIKKYAVIIGKKRINFYKGSGISGTTCDKIYEENYITLPGGFQLPVAIITETWTISANDIEMPVNADGLLPAFAEQYLKDVMVAGTILSREETITEADGLLRLQGKYACSEMIAQDRNEEIIKPYGNDN